MPENENNEETELPEETKVEVPNVDVDTIREQVKAELEAKQEEEKELSKLSSEERAQREMEDREAKLAEREAEMAYKEALAETKAELVKRDIPAEFSSMVVGVDNKQTFENIKTFETQFNAAVNDAVKSRMAGTVAGTEQTLGGSTNTGADVDVNSSEALRSIFGKH